MMNVYRDMLPEIGGYLTDKSKIHLPRLELFIQEISRREPLYFQQRAIDERDQGYADEGYKAHYYKVTLLNTGRLVLSVCLFDDVTDSVSVLSCDDKTRSLGGNGIIIPIHVSVNEISARAQCHFVISISRSHK